MSVEDTLNERGKVYGSYSGLSNQAQALKDVMKSHPGWDRLSPAQKETLELIATKIARILNGDPDHADNWNDIAGYATLVIRKEK